MCCHKGGWRVSGGSLETAGLIVLNDLVIVTLLNAILEDGRLIWAEHDGSYILGIRPEIV